MASQIVVKTCQYHTPPPRLPLLPLTFFFFFVCASTWVSPSWSAGPEYSYDDGPTGPENWGNLRPDWQACGAGRSQSPINIYKKEVEIVKADSTLCFNYSRGHANLHLGTHDVGVEWMKDGGAVYWEGQEYRLLELHTHSPSEHKVKNERFPMEMHLVHKGPNGKLLVVSLKFKYGSTSSFLDEIVHELPALINGSKKDHLLENFSVKDIKFGDHYYHYMGSLTTPPCTEGVTWIIMKKSHSFSRAQADTIANALKGDNARPLQAVYNRMVFEDHHHD